MDELTPRVLTLSEILAMQFTEQPSWIGSSVLPKSGKLLLGGDPKIGKTFMLIEIGRAITTGQHVFGNPMLATEPGKVLLIDQEIGERGMQERVTKIFNDKDSRSAGPRFGFVCKDCSIQLDTPEGLQHLYKAIREHQPNVLLLDPIQELHTSDENSASDLTKMFNNVNQLINDFKHLELSVIMTHHFQKRPQDTKHYDPLAVTNFRGSGKWGGYPDSIMTVQRIEGVAGWQGKGWDLRVKYTLRHGEALDIMNLTANHDGDLRVRWEGERRPANVNMGRPNLTPIQMDLN